LYIPKLSTKTNQVHNIIARVYHLPAYSKATWIIVFALSIASFMNRSTINQKIWVGSNQYETNPVRLGHFPCSFLTI